MTPGAEDQPNDLAAVLFDMDGTLVDSEKVWDVGLVELAGRYGGVLSAAARARMVGSSMVNSMIILHEDIGQPWRDPTASVTWLEQRVKELFAAGLVWKPGAVELLGAVAAVGLPAALVTATRRHLVDVALLSIGRDRFGAIVCGDEVDEGKPHPRPYLMAAELLGVDIRRCVAIEDSPTGVASARAAGAVVLAVPSEVDLTDLDRVTLVDSLVEVDVPYLRSLVRAGSDGATPDGATPDGTAPDGTAPDGTAPDGAAPDGAAQNNAGGTPTPMGVPPATPVPYS